MPQDQEVLFTEADFRHFSALIKHLAGIHMAPAKMPLVQGRLRQRVGELGLKTFADYREHLARLPAGHEEFQVFVNLLTTNKTEFFREPRHFQFLAEWARDFWRKAAGRSLRIWCAASSTGEEPYTLALVLARLGGGPFEIVASDIDTEVLARAERGVYPVQKLAEVPQEYRDPGFDLGRGQISGWMRIKPEHRRRVTYFQHNLIDPALPGEGEFDLIFCRNVLIYFRPETCEQIVNKLCRAVRPGGLLFIGHSESLQNVKTPWKPLRASVYQKRSS
jgi:chemotaxis methyl-accepting protein methylase